MIAQRRGVLGWRGVVVMAALIVAMVAFIALRRWERAHANVAAPAVARGVLESLPAGAVVAAELDLRALRAHPLTAAWLREPRVLEGLGDITAICGADPLEQVERLGVAVPTSNEAGFGLVALGSIDAGLLSTCAERLIARRGGTPSRELVAGFSVVRDAALPEGARVAVRRGGPLFLAEPAYLARALRMLTSAQPSLADDPAHAALRRRVGDGVLVVTAVLSKEQRTTLAVELERQGVIGSPFVGLAGGAVAVSLGERLDWHVVASCDAGGSAAAIGDQLRQELKTQAATPLAKLVGYASLLERVTVEVDGSDVHLRAALPPEDVLFVFRRVVALQRLAGGDAAPAANPLAPASTGAPAKDEK